jgi:lipopolysaccharide biosynthesis regulator YciM
MARGGPKLRYAAAAAAGMLLPLTGGLLHAQDLHPLRSDDKPIDRPDLAEPVLRRIEAPYLTPEERKNLRVFHGVWRESDLDTPQRRATAALLRGAYDDASFEDGSVAPEDRAEAALLRGEPEQALGLLGEAASPRAQRVRAESLESLGRPQEAVGAADALLARLGELAGSDDQYEVARAMLLRSRLAPQTTREGGDFKAVMALLARARQGDGTLYWPIYLAEAELLYDKDNSAEGAAAAKQALSMNPSSARAWALMGRLAVQGFNFEGAEQAARQLQRLDAQSSPEAAAILARAALRQNDPEGARSALRPALDRLPQKRELLALQAAAAALSYDQMLTNELLASFDRLSPGSPLALFETGRALSEARQYDLAAGYLQRAAERSPHWSEPLIELGLMKLQAGEDLASRDALRQAVALDPFNIRAGNTLKLVEELSRYVRLESDHFIIRYRPGEDEIMARDMVAPLEAMYRRVTGPGPGGIDHEPARKTIIDLMPDQRWFAVRIAGITRIHTMAASTGPCIAMETPRTGPRHTVGTYDWLRVVRHEFTHTVTLSRTNNRIPHWFTEAAAVYLEDAPRAYNTCRLLQEAIENDQLFDLREINIAFVRPKRRTDRALAYAQGHWMYQYMVQQWGDRAPLDLMDRYAAGMRQDAAFRQVLGVDESRFLSDFKSWAREQVASWGLGVKPGEPSLGQILLLEAGSTAGSRQGLEDKLGAFTTDAAYALAVGQEAPEWDPDLPSPSYAIVSKWLEKYPTHSGLLAAAVGFALALHDEKATEETIPLLERYATVRPVDPLPHQKLAQFYLARAEGRDRAIPHLEWLDAREQNSPAYAAELARQYAAAADWPRAREKAERAATLAPYDAVQRELAATIALQAGDYDAAVRHITALVGLEPDRDIHKKRLEAARRLLEQNAAH